MVCPFLLLTAIYAGVSQHHSTSERQSSIAYDGKGEGDHARFRRILAHVVSPRPSCAAVARIGKGNSRRTWS